MSVPIEEVRSFFLDLHSRIIAGLEKEDGQKKFFIDRWERPATSGVQGLGGGGLTCVMEEGQVFERAGVNFSDVTGASLPPSATVRNPTLANKPFRALGISMVMHPKNPHVPTSHMNVRMLSAGDVWWFGGGFDLTPYVPYEDDVRSWHQVARESCDPNGLHIYPELKKRCDDYFFLPHRNETRGVGGLFVDDLNQNAEHIGGDWKHCFSLTQRIGEGFLKAYVPIVQSRKRTAFTEEERAFQLYRRGRYVEFNLVFDRGTLFGLQSKGRTESILVSMPPLCSWSYECPSPKLNERLQPYLKPRSSSD